MNKPIPKILLFSGIDKSGKSALRTELLKKIPNQLTIDRLFPSNYVYAKFYDRASENFEFIKQLDKTFKDIGIIIYKYCDYKTYYIRCISSDHDILSITEFKTQTGWKSQLKSDSTARAKQAKLDAMKDVGSHSGGPIDNVGPDKNDYDKGVEDAFKETK